MNIKTNKHGEKYIEEVNKLSFERLDSQSVFLDLYKESFQENTVYVFLGTDSGLLMKYFNKKPVEGAKFVFVERPEYIDYVKSQCEEIEFGKDIYLFSTAEFTFNALNEYFIEYVLRAAFTLMKSLAVQDKHLEYYELWKKYVEEIKVFSTGELGNLDSRGFMDVQLETVCDLAKPMSHIKNSLDGQPAVLLGGGPSVDNVMGWVKENQNNIIIFAVGRIAKRLIAEGITPHFVIMVDPFPDCFDNHKDLLHLSEKSILLYGNHPNPIISGQWQGLVAYSRSRFVWGQSKGEENQLMFSGPTVTNAALDMMLYLGCKNIYLAGVDFCFTSSGISHESGSFESKVGAVMKIDVWLTNYKDEKVGTQSDYAQARAAMETQINNHINNGEQFQVTNLSPLAAQIEHVDYQGFETIKIQNAEKIPTLMNELKTKLQLSNEELTGYYQYVKKELSKQVKLFSKVKKMAAKGVKDAGKLFENEEQISKRSKVLIKEKKQVEKSLNGLENILFHYSPREFRKALEPISDNENMTREEIQKTFEGYFEGINISSSTYLEKILDTQELVKHRVDEMDPRKNLEDLAKNWLKNQLPGRLYIWLSRMHAEDSDKIKAEHPELVEKLSNAYEAQMKVVTPLEQRFIDDAEDPNFYYKRLEQFYDQNKLDMLQTTSEELKEKEGNVFKALADYGQGLVHDLKGEVDEAFQIFKAIDEPSLKYAVLQRRLKLAMMKQEYQVALDTLEALCNFSLNYMPKYADLMQLLGHIPAAVEIYIMYLNRRKEDVVAWLKLATLYEHVGHEEDATVIYKKVLELDPDNEIALNAINK